MSNKEQKKDVPTYTFDDDNDDVNIDSEQPSNLNSNIKNESIDDFIEPDKSTETINTKEVNLTNKVETKEDKKPSNTLRYIAYAVTLAGAITIFNMYNNLLKNYVSQLNLTNTLQEELTLANKVYENEINQYKRMIGVYEDESKNCKNKYDNLFAENQKLSDENKDLEDKLNSKPKYTGKKSTPKKVYDGKSSDKAVDKTTNYDANTKQPHLKLSKGILESMKNR